MRLAALLDKEHDQAFFHQSGHFFPIFHKNQQIRMILSIMIFVVHLSKNL